jgi:pimeloyl-ACP methyl ester carboxylesterase
MRAADSKLAARGTWLATRLLGSLSPRLAGPVAARLWFTPWRVPSGRRARQRQAEWLAGTQPVAFASGRYRIAGYSAGSGPAVVLAHGWGETGASLGAFVRPLVDAGYRVVGIDFPAHGRSSGTQTDGFEVAAALRDVCDSLGDVRAVVAHSMASLSAVYAAHEGLALDALVLIAPAPRLDHALDTFAELFSLPPKAKEGLRWTIDRRYGPHVWEQISAAALAPKVDVPALIVHDRDDPQVPLADAEALHAAWPGSRLITTESLGHARILRDPEVIHSVVSFLDEVVGPRAAVPALTDRAGDAAGA